MSKRRIKLRIIHLLKVLLIVVFSLNLNAQIAFDGNHDNKISISYGFTGDNQGITIMLDKGLNDYLSVATILSTVNAEKFNLTNATNFGFALRFHFVELLNYAEPNDLYIGGDIGHSTSGIHVGYIRQLNRRFGVKAEFYYGFISAIVESSGFEGINHFKNKPRVSVGLTFK